MYRLDFKTPTGREAPQHEENLSSGGKAHDHWASLRGKKHCRKVEMYLKGF